MTNRDEYSFDIPTFEELLEATSKEIPEELVVRFVDYLDIIR